MAAFATWHFFVVTFFACDEDVLSENPSFSLMTIANRSSGRFPACVNRFGDFVSCTAFSAILSFESDCFAENQVTFDVRQSGEFRWVIPFVSNWVWLHRPWKEKRGNRTKRHPFIHWLFREWPTPTLETSITNRLSVAVTHESLGRMQN